MPRSGNTKPSANAKPTCKKKKPTDWIEQFHSARIGEREFAEIQTALAPVSEAYLRKLLRESGVPLLIMVDGVRQDNFVELETSLLALLQEYEQSNRVRQLAVRRPVITAKEHARLAGRKTGNPGSRLHKIETIRWLSTWLENPPLFPEWVALRKLTMEFPAEPTDEE